MRLLSRMYVTGVIKSLNYYKMSRTMTKGDVSASHNTQLQGFYISLSKAIVEVHVYIQAVVYWACTSHVCT